MPKVKRGPSQKEIVAGVGQRMRWLRDLTMPNRSEAARLLGVDPSTLTKIEDGERAPNIFLIIAFANRFRASTDYLMRGILTSADHPALIAKLSAEHPELARLQHFDTAFRSTGTD